MLYHGGPEMNVETDYSKRWHACQYAAHPRTLLLAEWDRVELADLRVFIYFLPPVPSSCLNLVFRVKNVLA